MLAILQSLHSRAHAHLLLSRFRNEGFRLRRATRHCGQALSYHLVGSNDPCEDVLLLHNANRGDRPSLFAVIDGHGGRLVADYVHRQLPVEFDKRLADGLLPGLALQQALASVEASVLQASVSNQQVRPPFVIHPPTSTVLRHIAIARNHHALS